jgi:hypothetical protein
MGEGEGGGEQLNSYPPHLNPLPPRERKYFLCIPIYQSLITKKFLRFDILAIGNLVIIWLLVLGI